MKPIAVQKPRFNQNSTVSGLDDAEMTLELTELALTTNLKDQTVRRLPSARSTVSPDFLLEMVSAASMIMDRAEIEAMMKEIELATRPHPVAA
jgi:hypothetical protein